MNTAIDVAAPSVLELVGNTPLIRLRSVEARAGTGAEVWAKCEFANPGGSVKDRAARQMILDAMADGRLTAGKTLIDSTSGNTGVAYSMIGAALGVPVTLVMPANVSAPRKNITRAYGTEVIYSSELEGSDGAIRMVREIVAKDPDRWFFPDQYGNASNPRAHYRGTGPEIARQTGGRITHFVTGIGTTGTLMGTGRYFKDHHPQVRVVAMQPDDALHGLEGLKHLPSSIVPAIWRPDGIVDDTIWMPTDEGWEMSEDLVRHEGLFVGHSSGGNVAAALRLARGAGPGAVIVTILCDRGDRYFAPLAWNRPTVY
ncbi:MAG: cysteine synthase family protein [Kofleriaceae bacterium]|nr:cysteine synthase family protein [Myxococcales bacterium]MCB9563922.1 cysteine synthase family protein [Kofleriaceae bacterium]